MKKSEMIAEINWLYATTYRNYIDAVNNQIKYPNTSREYAAGARALWLVLAQLERQFRGIIDSDKRMNGYAIELVEQTLSEGEQIRSKEAA